MGRQRRFGLTLRCHTETIAGQTKRAPATTHEVGAARTMDAPPRSHQALGCAETVTPGLGPPVDRTQCARAV